ncbi:hypothetical protein FQN53_003084 [Emmonsiellopsis sp. PD_33]|nr:hypothetical protein FQN53_003084 [Emmonsiellopsis sp. PD_33]
MPTYDTIIIGAGYAGLSAATTLVAAGKKVLLLEARPRVGGRAWTIHHADGTYEDAGASFLGPQHTRMLALAADHGIKTFKIPTKGNTVFYHRGQRKEYSGFLPPLSPLARLDAFLAIRRFEGLAGAVDLEKPWETPKAAQWDLIALREWLGRACWTSEARESINVAVEGIWSVDASQFSLLHALWLSKAGVSFTVLSSVEGGAQEQLITGGGQAVAEKMARRLGSDVVRLGEAVMEVDQAGVEEVVVTTAKGRYTCRAVVIAIPPPLILNLRFTPRLPGQRVQMLQHMPMATNWKIYATYPKPMWRGNGLRGDVVSPDSYLSLMYDASPADQSRGVLMGFIYAAKAIAFAEMDEESRRKIVLGEIVRYFGDGAGKPSRVSMYTMLDEEWSTGCPVAVPAPGVWTMFREWMRKPIDRVHWAGTEMATSWSGYMEGAVQSGERAAGEVLGVLGGK